MATLLVAVVGATFAYFTATSNQQNANANINAQTAEVGGTDFKFTSEDSQKKIDYPGGIAIIAAKAVGTKAIENSTGNNYDFDFKLKISSSTTIETVLNWTLYKKVGDTPASLDIDSCKLVTDPQSGGEGTVTTHYYYSVDGKKSTEDAQDCTPTSLELTSELGSEVTRGTISKNNVTGADNILEHIDSESNSGTAYYYLVIEYENEDSDQGLTDAGSDKNTIDVTLTVDGEVAVTPVKAE